MRKVGLFLLMLCLVLGNVAFAEADVSFETVPLADNQEQLFELPFGNIHVYQIKDIEYHEEEGEDLLYVITCPDVVTDGSSQFVFDFDGNVESDPEYPQLDGFKRKYIEFDSGNAYSLEKGEDDTCYDHRMYDLNEGNDLGSLEDYVVGYNSDGIRVNENQIAYNVQKSSGSIEDPRFYIGTLDPFTASDASTAVIYSETGRTAAFDFSYDGSELIYGTVDCTGPSANYGIAIRTVDADDGHYIDEFIIEDTDYESGNGMNNAAMSLYTTKDYMVVLTRMEALNLGRIQRFTYAGELIDEVETNFHVSRMTEGPDGSTLYIQKMYDDGSCVAMEVMQVTWDKIEESSESVGRPKSVISERSFGGKTIAEFKDAGFGLLKVVDPETGVVDYKAPLKSDKNDVRLRIPFADIQAKLAAGADSLLINYQGREIAIPMSAFDCSELMAGMPCQDDATIEIHLETDEAGNVKVTVQLFVVEQVNAMTRLVHRKTIQ